LPVADCFCHEGGTPKPWKNHVIAATLAPSLLWNLHVCPTHSWLQLQLPTLLFGGPFGEWNNGTKSKQQMSRSFIIGNSKICRLQRPPTIEQHIIRTE
jgi:hypothetical protein